MLAYQRSPGAIKDARAELDTKTGRVTIWAAEVDEDGTATVDLGGVRADEITLTVEGIRGEGFSLVGISEIDLGDDDLTATRTTRLPSTLSDLYGELPTQERSAFADTPLDVFLTRVTNTGDRAVQVGSHYHFFEANPALSFERDRARGFQSRPPSRSSGRPALAAPW